MKRAFSLVEVLAAVSLIGILVFLALPNIVRVKADSEEQLAEARCQALNIAAASFVQARGSTAANTAWSTAGATASPAQDRYELLAPYLAYAPANLVDYMPTGYVDRLSWPATIAPLSEITLAPAAGGEDGG